MQERSPVMTDANSETTSLATQGLLVQKWSIMWRSIVLSSLNKTLYPYCRYMRVLDLRDLEYLLEDPKFRGHIANKFFEGELQQFKFEEKVTKTYKRLDIPRVVIAMGDAVSRETPLLEQISGKVSGDALSKWVDRLPKLRRLELWEGSSIGEESVQDAIIAHCPHLEEISMFSWMSVKCDQQLSRLINKMRPHSLKSFQVISMSNVGPQTLIALNGHSESLKTMQLYLKGEETPSLRHLKGCIALQTLFLEDADGEVDLERYHHEAFLEIQDWLRGCKNLRHLDMLCFLSGAQILAPLLHAKDLQLESLIFTGYSAGQSLDHGLHDALAHQDSLRILDLKGYGDDMGRDDIEGLIGSLVQLKQLRVLRMHDISAYFSDDHISFLAQNLPNLEDFSVGGIGVTDKVLHSLAGLQKLQRTNLMALSSFTVDGLLEFVDKLGPGNQGLSLDVMMADPDTALSEEEQALVRSALAAKVEGTFQYMLVRGEQGL